MGLPHPYLIFSSFLNCSDILFQHLLAFPWISTTLVAAHLALPPRLDLAWVHMSSCRGSKLHVTFSFEKKRPSPNYLNRFNDRLNSSLVALSNTTFNRFTFLLICGVKLNTYLFSLYSNLYFLISFEFFNHFSIKIVWMLKLLLSNALLIDWKPKKINSQLTK